jgi:hypothetical protein
MKLSIVEDLKNNLIFYKDKISFIGLYLLEKNSPMHFLLHFPIVYLNPCLNKFNHYPTTTTATTATTATTTTKKGD